MVYHSILNIILYALWIYCLSIPLLRDSYIVLWLSYFATQINHCTNFLEHIWEDKYLKVELKSYKVGTLLISLLSY